MRIELNADIMNTLPIERFNEFLKQNKIRDDAVAYVYDFDNLFIGYLNKGKEFVKFPTKLETKLIKFLQEIKV